MSLIHQPNGPGGPKNPTNPPQETTPVTPAPIAGEASLESLRATFNQRQEAQIAEFLNANGLESSQKIYQNLATGSYVYRAQKDGGEVIVKVTVPSVFEDALGSVKFSEQYAHGEARSLESINTSAARLYPERKLFPELRGKISDGEQLHGVLIEYIPGKTGQEYLEALTIEDSRMSVEHMVNFLRSGLAGVRCLQDAGLRHRDLNLRNVIVGERGEATIIDFNFSKDLQQTAWTMIEPAGFYPADAYGPRGSSPSVDSYAIGMMALSLYTRRKPFELVAANGELQLDDVKLDPGVKKFLRKLCAKDPSQRYPDPETALKALSKIKIRGVEAVEEKVVPQRVTLGQRLGQFVAGIKARLKVGLIDGHPAVVGQISVDGLQFDTLLSEGSFNKSREEQHEYAAKLGYRMATVEENRAYVEDLLAKEKNGAINDAERNALKTYRKRYVRGRSSGVFVDAERKTVRGRTYVRDSTTRAFVDVRYEKIGIIKIPLDEVFSFSHHPGHKWRNGRDDNHPSIGALFVRASADIAQIAQEMVDSYAFDEKTGVSTFTVPAGVTDVDAMMALNEYFWKNHSGFNRDAVYADHLKWFENLPKKHPAHCQKRDYSQARQITITGVVEGTKGENRTTQGSVLESQSLVFSDPRDQALAAAIHACKHQGADLFQDLWVRGSVPGFALCTDQPYGVRADRYGDDRDRSIVAASGSPSPESK